MPSGWRGPTSSCKRHRPRPGSAEVGGLSPTDELLAEIKSAIAGQPSYGYRRIHALIRRRRAQDGGTAGNVKRVYRVMKAHGLLLGRVRDRLRQRRARAIAFTLDCCDRAAISWVATTGGIDSGDIRDLMIESVERRFELVNRLPSPIEWLSDNGSPYTARETRALARDIGLVPRTTPIESPQSNGMAEAFVKTFKRDYARVCARPDAASVLRQLDSWFEHTTASSAQSAGIPLAARIQENDGEEEDRERGRRCAPTSRCFTCTRYGLFTRRPFAYHATKAGRIVPHMGNVLQEITT